MIPEGIRTLKVLSSGTGSNNANKCLFDMNTKVTADSKSGEREQFQKIYRKLVKAIDNNVNKENVTKNDKYVMDCEELWAGSEDERGPGE